MTDELAAIRAEAVEIVRTMARLQAAERAKREADGDDGFRVVRASSFHERLVPRPAEPSTDATPSQAFKATLRFWAQRVAPQITLADWHTIVTHVGAAMPKVEPRAMRFYERRFHGLRLADGTLVLAWPTHREGTGRKSEGLVPSTGCGPKRALPQFGS